MWPLHQITGSPWSSDPGKKIRLVRVRASLYRNWNDPDRSSVAVPSIRRFSSRGSRFAVERRRGTGLEKGLVTVPSPRTVHSKREKSRSVNQGGRNERPRKGSRTQTRDTWIKLRSVCGSRAWTELGFPLRTVAERGFASFGFRFRPSGDTIPFRTVRTLGWDERTEMKRAEIASRFEMNRIDGWCVCMYVCMRWFKKSKIKKRKEKNCWWKLYVGIDM